MGLHLLKKVACSEHSLEVETGRWARIKDREKRICKECHRQSDGFCSEVADEWHALDVLCPRGDQRKVEVMEFLTRLLKEEQIEVKRDDGLAELLPKLGLLSRHRCLLGWKMMSTCFARIESEVLAPGD